MPNAGTGRWNVLFGLLAGALIGSIVGRVLFAFAFYQAVQNSVGCLQSSDCSGSSLLAPLLYAPERYTIVFVAVGLIVGGLTGAMLGVMSARRRQAQSAVGVAEGESAWPPSPTPPTVLYNDDVSR
jgi:uncharacterized protein YqgC (DUF456 family)